MFLIRGALIPSPFFFPAATLFSFRSRLSSLLRPWPRMNFMNSPAGVVSYRRPRALRCDGFSALLAASLTAVTMLSRCWPWAWRRDDVGRGFDFFSSSSSLFLQKNILTVMVATMAAPPCTGSRDFSYFSLYTLNQIFNGCIHSFFFCRYVNNMMQRKKCANNKNEKGRKARCFASVRLF